MYQSAIDWYFILGNVAMFIPLGIILPMFFSNMRKWYKPMIIGYIASFAIELTQLIFHIGLFELDDIFNNTSGCFLGYCIYILGESVFRRERIIKRRLYIAMGIWIFVIGFYSFAIMMGQPVFGYFR